MNEDEVEKWIDENLSLSLKPSKRKGHGIKRKTFTALIVVFVGALVLTASAGLITVFMSITTTVTVDETALQIDGNNCPYTIQDSFDNKKANDSWEVTYTITNSIDASFVINWSVVSDEGLHITIFNSGHDPCDNMTVEPFDTDYLYVNYTLEPLCEIGTYEATIEILPMEVYQ